MRLFRFHFEDEVKCGGCNWRTYNLYVLADTREEAKDLLRKGEAGLCGECMCDLLSEGKYRILTEEDTIPSKNGKVLENIRQLYLGYYNTDLNTEEFAEEFFYAVGELLEGKSLRELKLKHLKVEEL